MGLENIDLMQLRKLIIVLILNQLCIFAFGQGISFSQNLSWQDILQKARTENKFIFVDCFATWCGPCKWMDQQVYSNDTIGNFMNDNFISVKVQMDSTQRDSKEVQNWYGAAHDFEAKYSVLAYPSFLFFSPDGTIVHKDMGTKTIGDFLNVAKSAMDPHMGYYTLLSSYERGNLSYADMTKLANAARDFKEKELAARIAKDYIGHYLDSLSEEQILTKENLYFIDRYAAEVSSKSNIYHLYFKDNDRKMIDSIMGEPGYTILLINEVVYAEDVNLGLHAGLTAHQEPDWSKMEKIIKRDFGRAYVRTAVLRARVEYYKTNKDWRQYAKYFILREEYLGIRKMAANIVTAYALNDKAFEVFTYSSKKKDLHTALAWVNLSIKMQHNHPDAATVDTKANLLYKLGKREEGIALEKRALDLKPNNRELQENYSKMQQGMATWVM